MRAYRKFNSKRGFTLVELMIVVAIIGVLAALAIFGVSRYMASAKTSEAKNTVGQISKAGAAAFERENTTAEALAEGASGTQALRALCPLANLVPLTLAEVANKKYQPTTAANLDYQTAPWLCLRHQMSQPQQYQYGYNGPAAGAAPAVGQTFIALANGDLDGDAVPSQFTRTGTINQDLQTVRLETQVNVVDEFE